MSAVQSEVNNEAMPKKFKLYMLRAVLELMATQTSRSGLEVVTKA